MERFFANQILDYWIGLFLSVFLFLQFCCRADFLFYGGALDSETTWQTPEGEGKLVTNPPKLELELALEATLWQWWQWRRCFSLSPLHLQRAIQLSFPFGPGPAPFGPFGAAREV